MLVQSKVGQTSIKPNDESNSVTLAEKVAHSMKLLQQIFKDYENPALLLSGGKDSMVVLHLLRKLELMPKIIQYKFPIPKAKYEFTDKIITDWNLKVIHPQPTSCYVRVVNGHPEIITTYNTMGNILVPAGTLIESTAHDAIDAVTLFRDVQKEVTGASAALGFDAYITGVKKTDYDPVVGNVGEQVCTSDIVSFNDEADMVHPLANWTDQDIFMFTMQENIPYDGNRYAWSNEDKSFVQKPDFTTNPDNINVTGLESLIDLATKETPIGDDSDRTVYLA